MALPFNDSKIDARTNWRLDDIPGPHARIDELWQNQSWAPIIEE